MLANSLRVQRTLIFLLLNCSSLVTWRFMLEMGQDMNSANMSDMWMPPLSGQAWITIDFTNTLVMWIIMMVAMMTPSFMYMALGFIQVFRLRHPNQSAYLGTKYLCKINLTFKKSLQ